GPGKAADAAGIGADRLQLAAVLAPEPGLAEECLRLLAAEGTSLWVEAAAGPALEDPEGVPFAGCPRSAYVGVGVPPAGAGIGCDVRHDRLDPQLTDQVEGGRGALRV